MNEIILFKNDKFGEIRNVMEGATPWFVAKDVAKALGYKDPKAAVRDLVWSENKGRIEILTPGGKQKVTTINETGKKTKGWRNTPTLGGKQKEAKKNIKTYRVNLQKLII